MSQLGSWKVKSVWNSQKINRSSTWFLINQVRCFSLVIKLTIEHVFNGLKSVSEATVPWLKDKLAKRIQKWQGEVKAKVQTRMRVEDKFEHIPDRLLLFIHDVLS